VPSNPQVPSESLSEEHAATEPLGPAVQPLANAITGWKGFEDALKLIPGATVDIVQRADAKADHTKGLAFQREG
jgi:hypothetical protein